MGFLASIFGATKSQAQQVRSVGDHGFVDLDIPMASAATSPSGSTTLVARGILGGLPVGFSIEIHPTWNESSHDEVIFYFGRATIRSIGPSSDNFVAELARQYSLPAPGVHMRKIIEVDAVGLNSDPRLLESSPVHMKLFFNPNGPEDTYAEVFLNADLSAKVVQFHEKDLDYRAPLLKSLYEVA
jgi:hypothetical protein